MRISLIKREKVNDFILPMQIHGNYWITDTDKDGKERNLVNIIAFEGTWKMGGNFEVEIHENNEYVGEVILEIGKFYTLKIKEEEDIILYCNEVYESNTYQIMLKEDADIIVGSGESCNICYNNPFVAKEQAKLTYKNNEWAITAITTDHYIYVNNKGVNSSKLYNGDIVFIMGLKIIILKNNMIINNVNNLKVDGTLFVRSKYPIQNIKDFENEDEKEVNYYDESDYFYRAPRFRNLSERKVMAIDPAPPKTPEDKTPIIFVVGPMITMGLTSLVSLFTSISSTISNNKPIMTALPSIILGVAMLTTMLLWPMLSKKYQSKMRKEGEKARQQKYSAYIETKRNLLKEMMKQQTESLLQNFPSLEELKKVILFKKSNLWEREINHADFLNLRIGLGNKPVDVDIRYPEEHFSMDEDSLMKIVGNLVNDSKELVNVPITLPFATKYIAAIIGEEKNTTSLTYGLLLQVMAYHSYDDIKLIIFTNEEKQKNWDFARVLPHSWDNDKSTRFFATNANEMKQISSVLEPEFQARMYNQNDNGISLKESDYKSYKPYYFIITDDFKTARDIELIKDVLEQKMNVGFSLLILNDKFNNLPNECKSFISIGQDNKAVIFEEELTNDGEIKVLVDNDPSLDLNEISMKLANIPIGLEENNSNFPKVISFLEMYNVGKVEQLNSFNRWKTNSPINSLQAPVGVDKSGKLFELDVHEKFHGPHGLIAGMTGSGKSEFIITYVLSLAVNYHPDEVSFILIDYKGGGVAGAFQNKEMGIKLPHIAGTITNLDTVEMKRSLVSIESELRRRQRLFNDARQKTNESTIDIYKYQKLYREGLLSEPMSHLLIISDEFAELKLQQPEFMEQLISTARIGRSLGVHLILATQKPSGIVDDQIWSNSRFRVCLKVQEKSDSQDMLKSPDAALIKNVGRFYLQVGYNEFYAMGQSAWCGAKYLPKDKLKKKIDNSLTFVNNTGYVVKTVEDNKIISTENRGEELPNIVKYLSDIAKEAKIDTKQLWLDRIPDLIYVDNLKKKYGRKPVKGAINPIIGEFDDPSEQRQDLLTLDLSNDGNTIIYGSADSGETVLLSSVVYSSIMEHDSDEVNFYIMDFGSEMLKIFSKAPQVGEVLLMNNEEKVTNLFKKINRTIEERKKIFVDYNGSFNFYNKKSQNRLPLMVIILNNYEAFIETYSQFEDVLIQITREGFRYGIVFIVTCSGAGSMRYKLRQNFKQELVLQMNDESDYVGILGNLKGVYPSKSVGRGLLKKDKIYEFQSAYPFHPDKMSSFLSIVCERLREQAKLVAEKIPILPEVVKEEDINANLRDISSIPLGIDKSSLEIATWDFASNLSTVISSLEIANMEFFIKAFIRQFNNLACTFFVMDSLQTIENPNYRNNIIYMNSGFDTFIDSIHKNVKTQYDAYVKNNYNMNILSGVKPAIIMIIGVENFLNKLTDESKKKYEEIIKFTASIQTLKLIFVDTIDIFKKIEYDTWYKAIVKNTQGIWVGNGIAEQYSLKINRVTKDLQQDVEKDFGYIIKRGNAYLTKFLSEE